VPVRFFIEGHTIMSYANDKDNKIRDLIGEAMHRLDKEDETIRFDDEERELLIGRLKQCLVSESVLENHLQLVRDLTQARAKRAGGSAELSWLYRAADRTDPMEDTVINEGLDAFDDQLNMAAMLLNTPGLIDLHERIESILLREELADEDVASYWDSIAADVGLECAREAGLTEYDIEQMARDMVERMASSDRASAGAEMAGMLGVRSDKTDGEEDVDDNLEVLESGTVPLPLASWSPRTLAEQMLKEGETPYLECRLEQRGSGEDVKRELVVRLRGLPHGRGVAVRAIVTFSEHVLDKQQSEQRDVPGPIRVLWPTHTLKGTHASVRLEYEKREENTKEVQHIRAQLSLPDDVNFQDAPQ